MRRIFANKLYMPLLFSISLNVNQSEQLIKIPNMNIHEYQAKDILAKYGVKVSQGHLATNPDEAVEAAKKVKSRKRL